MSGRLRVVRSRLAAVAHDTLAVPLAWYLAYWLRFNLERIPETYLSAAWALLPVVLTVQVVSNLFFGLYRGVWRFASIPDLVRIAKAVVVGVLAFSLAAFMLTRMEGVPRSVPPLYALLLFSVLAGNRLVYRIAKDRRLPNREGTRVLIVGCGAAGEMLARDLKRQREQRYIPVGFVDDSARRQGQEIHGIRVLGPTDRIAEVSEAEAVDLIIIAIANIDAPTMRRIVGHCEAAGVPFRTIPGLDEFVSGEVTLSSIREVRIEDLLGRAQVTLDTAALTRAVAGKSVLVTGGGGSIGAELCRQIARFGPSRLVIADHSEYNLYRIVEELKERWRTLSLAPRLIDVADEAAFAAFCADVKPQIVFHSAAYKHVPLLESHVSEAVINNIGGTLSVSRAAEAAGCEMFVLISTDKAVLPNNVMGRTKRVAELLCKARSATSGMPHTIVRFGNVLDSAGSVVPLFRRQIASGGPVTVTHAEMTRFFMTIPEAAQLIIEACALGEGSEVFVLDMGEPIPILFLAEQMIRLSGREPGTDIEIEVTGLRPGEKLAEDLFYPDERVEATRQARILKASQDTRGGQAVLEHIAGLVAAAREAAPAAEVEARLKALTSGRSGAPAEPENAPVGKVVPLKKL